MNNNVSSVVKQEALEYGLEEAHLISYFRFWVNVNKKKKKTLTNFRDGKWWMFNSAKSISEDFLFMNEQKVKRIIRSLCDQGVIITSSDMNKWKIDRTLWYAFV